MTQDVAHTPFSPNDVVLIADDESFSRFMAAEMLAQLGKPKTITARDGSETMTALTGEAARAIRLVLLDFNMPAPNGIEVLKRIRSGECAVAHDTVVMMVTGVETWGLLPAALALDVDAFLPKPMSVANLRHYLEATSGAARGIGSPDGYAAIDVEGIRVRDAAGSVLDGAEPVKVADLTEDMVIAENLSSPEGDLLVSQGTAVTPRLTRLLRGLAAAGLPVAEIQVVRHS